MAQFESMVLPPRLPLVVLPANRNGTTDKDSRLVNCYIETNAQQELWVIKRPGLVENTVILAAAGRGTFQWQGDVYSIFAGTLFRNGISVGSGLDQTNGVYQFSQIKGAIPKMVFGNGIKTYAYTVAGGITADLRSIDIDFPLITVKGIGYLNGATYVMNPQAEIWNSVVNSVSNPGDWSALAFINAQIEPDDGIQLSKQLVYIIAFNQWSTEVFFDAGNPTGSPLGPVQGSKVNYGCASADSVQRIDDKLLWLSATQSGAVQVAIMEQLNVRIISTDAIDRLLDDADLSTVYSWQLKFDGHVFYGVTIKNTNLTLVYDISEDIWHQWTDANGNYFPFVSSTYDTARRNIFQHESNGRLYFVDADIYTDHGNKITVDIYTPIFDANTRRRKQMNQMLFIGDQVTGSILQVRKSDDDYQTWSNFRRVELGAKNPYLRNCGSFNKRAYHLRHQSNTPLRMQAVEIQYDIGTL